MYDGPFNTKLGNKTQLRGEYYVFTFTCVDEWGRHAPFSAAATCAACTYLMLHWRACCLRPAATLLFDPADIALYHASCTDTVTVSVKNRFKTTLTPTFKKKKKTYWPGVKKKTQLSLWVNETKAECINLFIRRILFTVICHWVMIVLYWCSSVIPSQMHIFRNMSG